MYKRFINIVLFTLLIFVIENNTVIAGSANVVPPKQLVWPFEGIFGTFDRQSAQRGAQVYLEVCASCHGLKHLYYRNLKEIGFSDAEISAIAREEMVLDGPNDEGEMFERFGRASDPFVSPYPNREAAQAANNGAYPVDLSLLVKARADGANYIYSILTGYKEPPSNVHLMDSLFYNPYFEGKQISMPPPLMDDQVEYTDGTDATVEQMAKDVTIFLQWAAEPEMERRNAMGIKVMIYLLIFTIIFGISKNRIWRDVK